MPSHEPTDTPWSDTDTVLAALAAATDRLLATIDAMPAAAWREASLLPGWTRAHVLAHLALNAKALGGVLTTATSDDPLPMYASARRRDTDIAQMARQRPAQIADRLAVGAAVLAAHMGGGPTPQEALEAVGRVGEVGGADAGRAAGTTVIATFAAADAARVAAGGLLPARTTMLGDAPDPQPLPTAGTFERTPGGPLMRLVDVPWMRWREVEIHHADLGLGYGAADWPDVFTDYLLSVAARDRDGEVDAVLRPTDGNDDGPGERILGAGGPVIAGTRAALVWWLIGRGSGEGLTAERLPDLGPWVHRPRR